MMFKNKYFGIFITLVNIIIISTAVYFFSHRQNEILNFSFPGMDTNVLGQVAQLFISPTRIPPTLTPTSISSPTPTPTITLTPTPIEHTVAFLHAPGDLMEKNLATFTWLVNGPEMTIHTTTVYFGLTANPGTLSKNTAPMETKYTDKVKDFLGGDYQVPLQFVGNARLDIPGTYYARAYALINGMNYWSEEHVFVVNKLPRNDIRMLDYPKKVSKGENAVFTWEITGPSNITNYTAIVAGRASKPGSMDESVDIADTPYLVLVKEFTNGTYTIPLRFIGNASIVESGTLYYRAYAWINNKNIWSDEFTLEVQ